MQAEGEGTRPTSCRASSEIASPVTRTLEHDHACITLGMISNMFRGCEKKELEQGNAPLQILRNAKQTVQDRDPRERVERGGLVDRRQAGFERRDELDWLPSAVVQALPLFGGGRLPQVFVAGHRQLNLEGGESMRVAEKGRICKRDAMNQLSSRLKRIATGRCSRSTSMAKTICARRFATSSSIHACH